MGGIIDCEMHIGDEVFVHGYIDEIRNDTIIIRNVGGYFGTSRDEVFYYEDDGYGTMNEADRKTEPTISKMEQVEDEPQTSGTPYKIEPSSVCKTEPQRGCDADCNEDCTECAKEWQDWKDQMWTEAVIASKDEPQTDCSWK